MTRLLKSVTRWARHTVARRAVRLPAPRPLLPASRHRSGRVQ